MLKIVPSIAVGFVVQQVALHWAAGTPYLRLAQPPATLLIASFLLKLWKDHR